MYISQYADFLLGFAARCVRSPANRELSTPEIPTQPICLSPAATSDLWAALCVSKRKVQQSIGQMVIMSLTPASCHLLSLQTCTTRWLWWQSVFLRIRRYQKHQFVSVTPTRFTLLRHGGFTPFHPIKYGKLKAGRKVRGTTIGQFPNRLREIWTSYTILKYLFHETMSKRNEQDGKKPMSLSISLIDPNPNSVQ